MITTLIQQLRRLKLHGMAEALQLQTEQPGAYSELSFQERLQLLIDAEELSGTQRKQQRLLQQAKLKLRANIEEIDYTHARNITKSQIAQLAWLQLGQNVLITGPCGSGKTYLGCALGHQACLHANSVRYFRLSRLLLQITQSKADGSYNKMLTTLANTQLLIIDDWGLEPLKTAHRNDLLEVMDDRHGQHSVIIISQLPTDQWHNSIGDNTLADAILDRLMHNAYRIVLRGESMRKKGGGY